MIVAIGAEKGAPGVTTATLALGLVWPTDRVVLEADPSGGDLLFGLRAPDGARLASDRSVTELAHAARGTAPQPIPAYAQPTALGVDVIPGAVSAETFRGTANLWPRIAAVSSAWPGAVLADLGRVQPGHPALSLARLAVGMVVVGRPTASGLYRLRTRVGELAATLGDASRDRSPVAVVMACPPRDHKQVSADVTAMLSAARIPVPVAGCLAWDPLAAQQLLDGQVPQQRRSALVGSARVVAERLFSLWPELAAALPALPEPARGRAVPAVVGATAPRPAAAGPRRGGVLR